MFQKAVTSYFSKHNYKSFNPKAVLFDMDGVLFDSMPYHAKAWRRAMAEAGVDFSEYDAYLNEGRTGVSTIDTEFLKVFGRRSTPEEQQRIYKQKSDYFKSYGKEAVPMPYALPLVQKVKLQGLMRLIVTGSGEQSLFDKIECFYPDHLFSPQLMVTAFDVKHGKPDPEPYLMGLQKAGVAPNEAIVVENAPLGVQASVAAGIFTIAVNTGILENDVLAAAGADLVFSSMKEVLEKWEEILLSV